VIVDYSKFNSVIFAVGDHAWHGHPEPLSCPPGRSRRSLATYYYTLHCDDVDASEYSSTSYQRRPGEKINHEIEKLRDLRRKGRLRDETT
tara:strand:+ start:259 stop:528 length:270 start_codon:yes stop_codon:yes gene_type:complete